MDDVGNSSVDSYHLHASETQQLSYVSMTDAPSVICHNLCGVAMWGQPSANDGSTCNIP